MSTASGGMRPGLATVFSVVGFGALGICLLGIASLASGDAVVGVSGLGSVPGAVGFGVALAVFAMVLLPALRSARPSYGAAALTGISAPLAYLAGLVAGAIATGIDPALALSAASGFALSWFSVVIAAAAGVSGWVGVALVRTRAKPPQWSWERDEDDD